MNREQYRSYNSDSLLDVEEGLSDRIHKEVIELEPSTEPDPEQDDNYAESAADEPSAKPNKIVAFILLMLSGNVLTLKEVSKYYSQMFVVALLFFISIMVLFGSLHLDVSHSQLVAQVQMLRERSVRLKEVRSERSSHPAVVEELKRRGIELMDSKQPAIIID